MTDAPRKVEQYEKRFGILAVEKGFITPEDLLEAMKIQLNEDIRLGTHRLVGEILLDMTKISTSQIEQVVKVLQNKTS